MTPIQRRQRIIELVESDPDCRRLLDEYREAERRLTGLTNRMPKKLRTFLWKLPGMGYFLHHRILTLVCGEMRFQDETDPPAQ